MTTPEQTINLVKKWLDNPESVSKEELRKAAADAAAEYWIKKYEKLAHKEG